MYEVSIDILRMFYCHCFFNIKIVGTQKLLFNFRCPIGCATCLATLCLSCNSNWGLNKKNKCVVTGSDQCTVREYLDGSICSNCHNDCDSCYGQTEANCLTCPAPYLLQNQKYVYFFFFVSLPTLKMLYFYGIFSNVFFL